MAQRPLTHSELAAKLIVEGSLDKIAGKTTEKFPIDGVKLDDDQRRGFGRQPGGSTIFYPIDPNGVFIDFHGAATTVWFQNADARDALKVFERALKKSYPKAVQREDKPHPKDPHARQRSYDVPLGRDRAATVDIAYPAADAEPRGFLARILAYGKTEKTKKN
jgi:hypothetical protein